MTVVVTGRGVVSSIGESPDGFFDALLAKRSGIADGIGACVDFDPESTMSPKEARRADRYTQLAVAAAKQAAEEAGLPDGVDPQRLGVLVGTGVGGLVTLQAECEAWLNGGDRAVSPHFVPMMMPNAAAGTIAMRVGAQGPGFSVSSACATGGHAIGEAMRMIDRGEADAVIAGGTEAALTGLCIAAFRRMGALSREGVSRPFDAGRDGFVMGEGACVLVLEELEAARARGAPVYAEVLGYGTSNDAYHMAAPEPAAIGVGEMMRSALERAEVDPARVGYINAHGTSTPLGDAAETKAIKDVFGDHAYELAVSSTKSVMGHCFGAAGAIEAMMCVLAVRDGVLPPTINYEHPDPTCDLDYVPNESRETEVDVAVSNAMGLGGHNACVLIGRLAD